MFVARSSQQTRRAGTAGRERRAAPGPRLAPHSGVLGGLGPAFPLGARAGGAGRDQGPQAAAGAGRGPHAVPVQRKVGFEFETVWGFLPARASTGADDKSNEPLKRNEVIADGGDWKVQPDSPWNRGARSMEYKTRAFDEGESEEAVGRVVASLLAFADALEDGESVSRGDGQGGAAVTRSRRNVQVIADEPLRAVPQVTGAFRLDRILALLSEISSPGAKKLFGNQKVIQRVAGRAGGDERRDPAYAGFVALLASYVAESQRINALYVQARERGEEPVPLGYAKAIAPVLARTNLGAIAKRIALPPTRVFVGDVLEAAGLDRTAIRTKLFPMGVSGQNPQRTIEAHPDITVNEWLVRIHGLHQDFEWNETPNEAGRRFGLEGAGLLEGPAPVLELRNLNELPAKKWQAMAKTVFKLVQKLNAAGQRGREAPEEKESASVPLPSASTEVKPPEERVPVRREPATNYYEARATAKGNVRDDDLNAVGAYATGCTILFNNALRRTFSTGFLRPGKVHVWGMVVRNAAGEEIPPSKWVKGWIVYERLGRPRPLQQS